jgi:Arylsulfotransferase (ASST)
MTIVEQLRLKRAGVGLRAYDPERACPGLTLFTPLAGGDTAYLIDLEGNVAHTWATPYPPGLYGYLTERGTLFYNGKIVEEPGRLIAGQPWKGGVALEMDWRGRVLWEVRHPDHHHDGIRLRNGNVLLLCLTAIPRDLAARVRGGIPGTEFDGDMHADYFVELTTDGRAVWEWRSWEHLDPEADRIMGEQTRRDRWTHGNAVAELPDGNLVVSFRHICTVAIVDRGTGDIIWKLGPPALAYQHAPTPLPNGNLLIFDNGTHRLDANVPYSRVLEVEPATKRVAWSYQERRPIDFFSPLISNAQRLPNGNTLICEGSFGRLFEVTPDSLVVWEYVNPHFLPPVEHPNDPPNNTVFRAFRYSPAEIERARQVG